MYHVFRCCSPPILLAAVLAIGSLISPGCSQAKAFNKAAAPLGERIQTDFNHYVQAQSDEVRKTEETALLASFTQAIERGDAQGVAGVYFGIGNVRARYVSYLDDDPRFEAAGGADRKAIKLNNLNAFDYIVGLGTRQAARRPRRPTRKWRPPDRRASIQHRARDRI